MIVFSQKIFLALPDVWGPSAFLGGSNPFESPSDFRRRIHVSAHSYEKSSRSTGLALRWSPYETPSFSVSIIPVSAASELGSVVRRDDRS